MPSEFVDEKLPGEILSKLASFREFGTFCDVILEADSSSKDKSEPTSPTSIRAHKLVLAAASPYFRYLIEHLNISNWMEEADFAKAHGCTELEDAAVLFARQHFWELVESEELMSMNETTFLHFISDDRLNSKDAVFEAVVNWVKHDSSRRASLPNVLVGVRLPLMSREFLLNRVYNEPMIRESSACMGMLGTVFHNMLSKTRPQAFLRIGIVVAKLHFLR
ncbi:hypothetical protein Q1695_011327 [Nippostrongylus brasiliensis]|nr:hypothetical protein Q1695_011327 [Nippostrongylus brasiliensis]